MLDLTGVDAGQVTVSTQHAAIGFQNIVDGAVASRGAGFLYAAGATSASFGIQIFDLAVPGAPTVGDAKRGLILLDANPLLPRVACGNASDATATASATPSGLLER